MSLLGQCFFDKKMIGDSINFRTLKWRENENERGD